MRTTTDAERRHLQSACCPKCQEPDSLGFRVRNFLREFYCMVCGAAWRLR